MHKKTLLFALGLFVLLPFSVFAQPSGTATGTPAPSSGTITGAPAPSSGTITGSPTATGPTGPQVMFEKLPNPLGGAGINDLSGAIGRITDVILMLAIPFITLAIIYSGFLFVRAQGNPDKLKEARRTLLWTLLGSLILMGSYTIANAVINTVQKLGTATADTVQDIGTKPK